MASFSALLLLALPALAVASAGGRGVEGRQRESSLVQTWGEALDGAHSTATPVTRVVNLLKEMKETLSKEMEEDEALYDKLACWCNNNQYEKGNAISEGEAKIKELTSTIEEATAKKAELETTIKQLEEDVATNKKALAEATAMREKEAKAFHGMELDSIQAVENLKAAIMVLGRHHGSAFPQISLNLLQESTGEKRASDIPWSSYHESRMERTFDQFLGDNDFEAASGKVVEPHKFLQQSIQADTAQAEVIARPANSADWSYEEKAILKKALRSASAFMQAKHHDEYAPSYAAQSGEIFGILKQLKEQMEGDLSEAQKAEAEAAATFAELRSSKTAEIEAGEKQAETKEDQLASTSMELAEAKEDLEKTEATLSEDQKFMITLKETCTDADKNFEARKAARLSEIKAVGETIEILTSDESKDLFKDSYSFLQTSSRRHSSLRQEAAALLRRAGSPELAILATKVELDAFSRVKKAIDDMISQLKKESSDEVKKHDWCNSELQSNEVATMKAEDLKAELTAKVEDLASSIEKLEDEIAKAKMDVSQLQVELQRASENRKKENMDFQKTVADQRATQDVLKTALEKLATYYDEESLMQKGGKGATSQKKAGQTPPVPQMEYSKSAGAGGVMSMIEKLIGEAKEVEADARKSEVEAQAQYEALVAETNDSVAALQEAIVSHTKAKAAAGKEKTETAEDLADTGKEIEDLGKYNGELHGECDYLIKNFSIRQEGRAQEVEALQQAKQILSGAMS